MNIALQAFEANADGRDYMVGDIHGCFYMLEPLLDRIGFDHACDRLFSVGDLVDRGPDSERAGEFLDQPWFHAIRGNHEQMLLDAVAEGGVDSAHQLWLLNGGGWFEQLDPAARQSLAERMAVLPYAFEIALADGGRAALVHADVLDNSWPRTRAALVAGPPDAETAQTLVWQRRRARALDARVPCEVAVDDIDLIAFGHTPMAAPIACANTRWIDTGAFAGGRLSVAELAVEGEVWSIAADLEDLDSGWRRYG